MKRVALFLTTLLLASGASAQLFSDNRLGGAVLGGVLGGVIGHNNNRQTAEGIGIGAGLGYLLGSLNDYDSGPRYSSRRTSISVGYGNGWGGWGGWGHRPYGRRFGRWNHPHWGFRRSYFGRRHFGPGWGVTYSTYSPAVVYTSPAYVTPAATAYTVPATTTTQTTVTRSRPNYALGGAAVGGLLGAVIGHNSDRQTAEGAAIGAGAGLLLGGIAEHSARKRETEAAVARAAQARVAQQAPTQHRAPASGRSTSLYAPGVVSGRTPVAQESTSTAAGRQPAAPSNYNSMTAANRLFGR